MSEKLARSKYNDYMVHKYKYQLQQLVDTTKPDNKVTKIETF